MHSFFKKELQILYSNAELSIVWDAICETFIPNKPSTENNISESEMLLFFNAIKKLKTGMPYQYVCGFADFYYLKIGVNKHTLIPRPETEELVDWIIKSEENNTYSVKDICTGSGCIALALKSKKNRWNIEACDWYEDTLKQAQKNAASLQLNIDLKKEDALHLEDSEYKYDIIVSNPPYISEEEKKGMHDNVLKFEPHEALFGGEKDPLIFYKSIAEYGIKNLKSGGRIYFELNQYFAEEIKNILENYGYASVEIKKDMSGNWRMLKAISA